MVICITELLEASKLSKAQFSYQAVRDQSDLDPDDNPPDPALALAA